MSSDYKPWEAHPTIWKTEAAFLSFIRGGIRRYLWSKNPVKLEFEKSQKVEIPNTNPKSMTRFPTVKGYRCAMCEGLFKATDVQCDHKDGEHQLRSYKDIQAFVEGIVFVKIEDLQMLCKPCHLDKTYQQREGVSLEEARATRQAIAVEKKSTAVVVKFLTDNGYVAGKNAKDRRLQLIDHFMKENK
jgi:hypothetical protein